MWVEELISRFRDAALDREVPHFWSDEEVVSYLNEAVQEACERARLIEDRSTPSVCAVSVLAGESTYRLHASVLEIKRLTLDGRLLTETSIEELDAEHLGWESRSGRPQRFVFEQPTGAVPPRIRLVPTPNQTGSVALTVYRGPLKLLDVDSGSPEIHARFHEHLLHWMLHRAYQKHDAEAFDPNKAMDALAMFVRAFGERPDANVQRKHRDRAPPIVRSNW